MGLGHKSSTFYILDVNLILQSKKVKIYKLASILGYVYEDKFKSKHSLYREILIVVENE